MKKKNLYIYLILFLITGYAWLAWNIIEYSGRPDMPAMCMFKELTGLPCPSCGTTRALMLFISGHFLESILFNPLGILLALVMIVVPLWILTDSLRRDDSFFRTYLKMEYLLKHKMWLSLPAIAAVLVNWIWNITKGL